MANNTFSNTAGGNWSLGSNWSLGTVPDSNAAVTFASGTYTSKVDGTSPWFIQTLDVNVATVTLEIAEDITTQTLAGNVGAIDVDVGSTFTIGSLNSNSSTITVSNGAVMTVQNLNGNSGTIIAGSSGLVNLQGTGTGDFTVTGGTLQIASNFNGSGTIEMDSGIFWLAGQLGNSTYVSHGNDQLYFDSPQNTTNNTFSGVSPGDLLAIKGVTISSASYSGTVLTLNTSGGTYTFNNLSLASPDEATGATIGTTTFQGNSYGYIQLVCFARGTRIRTSEGQVAVEKLAIGDMVRMWDGTTERIKWIGIGRVLVTPGHRSPATPVIITKGALAPNVPRRNLRLTKGHSLFIDDALIPVEFLVNHRSIIWDDRAKEVEIYHVELERHGVLIAEGAPAESYRDDGNRWLFQNAGTHQHPWATESCAPVLTGGPIVDAAWRRLLDRAGPRPGVPMTDDPDVHLLVDGVRVDGVAKADGVYSFALPRQADVVRLVSRAGVPQELGTARDARSLGIALRRLVARWGTNSRVIEAIDPSLIEGFHQFEPLQGFRWTDGDARLPAALCPDVREAWELELHVGCQAQYPLFREEPRAAA